MASRSVIRLTPSSPASSRSAGNRSPGAITPSLITVSSRSTVSSNAFCARTGPSTAVSSSPDDGPVLCGNPAGGLDIAAALSINGRIINHLLFEGAAMAVNEQAAPLSEDEQTLHKMGYAQELRRRMSGFSNFAVSFTIISILSGCLTLYQYGMNTGGPAVMIWGWLGVGLMTLLVGLSMAEVCSSFPTAGGLYYWAAKLAPRNGPAWSWFTGWFTFLGQGAVTARTGVCAA